MSTLTSIKNDGIVSLVVKVGGEIIPDTVSIFSIHIEKSVNRISTAKLAILASTNDIGTFDESLYDIFILEKELTIEAGYYSVNEIIFKGKITHQALRIDSKTGSTIEIICNDLNFIHARIEANGSIITALNGDVTVIKPDANISVAFTITYGYDIIEFSGEIDSITQLGNLQARVKFRGTTLAAPAKFITLGGLGNRFNGNHFILGVVQTISNGNWISEITLGMPDKLF